MCGIIGYLGSKPSLPILMKGLEQLEYRGYDSTGVYIHTLDQSYRFRAQGTLDQLKKKIPKDFYQKPSFGIGHTRWATHGIPSKENAHPHQSGKITIVHNGIIENIDELRKKFPHSYTSQTDTEVIAAIISHFYSKEKDFFQSVLKAQELLEGSFSFIVTCEDLKNEVIGFRQGPPLIVGFGEDKEFFISSDLPALVQQWTSQVVILENSEFFHIKNQTCQFFSQFGEQIQKQKQKIKWNQITKDKGGYKHYMLKEIFEQPVSLRNLIQNPESLQQFKNEKLLTILKNAQKLFIVACGSSYYAALYGKYVLESLSQIPVEVDLASEFQYRNPMIRPKDPVLFISQSGETADTLSSFELAQKKGAFTLAFCNVENSSLDRSSDLSFYLKSGIEVGVASTKSFTSTLALLLLMAIHFQKNKKDQSTLKALHNLPIQVEDILSRNTQIWEWAQSFHQYQRFLYLGRGPHYPIALEGALKMKELAYTHAEGYPSGEMKHGPLALVDKNVLIIGLISNNIYMNKNIINFQEAYTRGGNILTIGNAPIGKLKNISTHHIPLPNGHQWTTPLLEVIVLQLLAYHFACSLNHNVDHPRNLAKSVTVE